MPKFSYLFSVLAVFLLVSQAYAANSTNSIVSSSSISYNSVTSNSTNAVSATANTQSNATNAISNAPEYACNISEALYLNHTLMCDKANATLKSISATAASFAISYNGVYVNTISVSTGSSVSQNLNNYYSVKISVQSVSSEIYVNSKYQKYAVVTLVVYANPTATVSKNSTSVISVTSGCNGKPCISSNTLANGNVVAQNSNVIASISSNGISATVGGSINSNAVTSNAISTSSGSSSSGKSTASNSASTANTNKSASNAGNVGPANTVPTNANAQNANTISRASVTQPVSVVSAITQIISSYVSAISCGFSVLFGGKC